MKVFEHNLCGTYMMEIIEKIHVTDVRDKGDIDKKEEEMKNIFDLGKKLAST
jgi:hypothetical protein